VSLRQDAIYRTLTSFGFFCDSETTGWTVWDCGKHNATQGIRLACTGEQTDCDQLKKGGIVNTIVRLPESCGLGLFARVSASWQPIGEKVPNHVQAIALSNKK
jgi:hypothetical protein